MDDPFLDFMTDRCVISDGRTGKGTLDRATGKMVYPEGSIRYEGPCSIQDRPSTVQGDQVGASVTDEHDVRLPVDTRGIKVGQVVEIEGREGVDWVIERIPERSMAMTLRLVVRRRTGKPTTAGVE